MKRKLLEHFEGVVEFGEISEDSFGATLYNIIEYKKRKKKWPEYTPIPEAVVEMKISSIPETEQEYIQEGFVFDWKIYNEKDNQGHFDTISFHRPKIVTQEIQEKCLEEADKLMKELGWEEPEVHK